MPHSARLLLRRALSPLCASRKAFLQGFLHGSCGLTFFTCFIVFYRPSYAPYLCFIVQPVDISFLWLLPGFDFADWSSPPNSSLARHEVWCIASSICFLYQRGSPRSGHRYCGWRQTVSQSPASASIQAHAMPFNNAYATSPRPSTVVALHVQTLTRI